MDEGFAFMQTVLMNSEQGRQMRGRLVEARRASRFTQEDVARELGVTRQTVSHWEHGSTEASWVDLARLCTLYGVSADQILYGLETVSFSVRGSGLTWLSRIAGGTQRPRLNESFGGLEELGQAPSGFGAL
jgi:transcriptional regulator with XRE-family HTH domain